MGRRDPAGNIASYFQDPLGSARVVAGPSGALAESDYYPFGGERVVASTLAPGNKYQFTGIERDTESGLDHTLFRQYAWNLGRWLSPDPLHGTPANPQSWNRYAYVLNNPMNGTDPLGLQCPSLYQAPSNCQDYGSAASSYGSPAAATAANIPGYGSGGFNQFDAARAAGGAPVAGYGEAQYQQNLIQTTLNNQGYETKIGEDGNIYVHQKATVCTTYECVSTPGPWVKLSQASQELQVKVAFAVAAGLSAGPVNGAWWVTLGLMTLPVSGPAVINGAVSAFVAAGVVEAARPGCLGEFASGLGPVPSAASTPCYAAGVATNTAIDYLRNH